MENINVINAIINKIRNANATVEVLEDNAGGLHLRVSKGATTVASSGWETQPGALAEALQGLAAGADPADWDVPARDELTAEQWAELAETATVVLDMDGVGATLGVAAARELGRIK